MAWLVALVSALAMVLPGLTPASYAEDGQSGQSTAASESSTASSQGRQTRESAGNDDSTGATYTAALDITKKVDKTVLTTPGEPFVYTINLDCSERDCVNATVTDLLPAGLKGFGITAVSVDPDTDADVKWTDNGKVVSQQPDTVGEKTGFSVSFGKSINGGNGLPIGSGSITLSLVVPVDFAPSDERNNTTITNTATSSATNAAEQFSSAPVTIKVAETLKAGLTKTWTSASGSNQQSFSAGAPSTMTLVPTNSSNVPVDTLVVQDPTTAVDGATDLDESNPFLIADFNGFGTSELPQGAEDVRVDAYVKAVDGTWNWVQGNAGPFPALPSGVDAAKVAGLRFTYSSATPSIVVGASTTLPINVTLRDLDRATDSDLSTSQRTLTNEATAHVAKGTTTSDPAGAEAPFTITPPTLSVATTKAFDPTRILAGASATATITGRNTGTAVNTLVVGDTDFFTNGFTFGGFTQAITWPTGAQSGKVVYHLANGTDRDVQFLSDTTPALPSGVAQADVTGFTLVFTGEEGKDTIAQDSGVTAKFTVTAATASGSPAFPFGSASTVQRVNTVTTDAQAANGNKAPQASKNAAITVVKPSLDVTLDKSLTPASQNLEPGDGVVASLKTTVNSKSSDLPVTHIEVEDTWNKESTGFWNAFDLTSIQPTDVPAHSTLKVEVQLDGDWIQVGTQTAGESAETLSLSSSQLNDALSSHGKTTTDITGVRFVYDSTSGNSFGTGPVVSPHPGFTVRSTTRLDPKTPVDTKDTAAQGAASGTTVAQKPTRYTNSAVSTGSGETKYGDTATGTATDTANADVIIYPRKTGKASIVKEWDKDSASDAQGNQDGGGTSVQSQTSSTRVTHLRWRVESGFGTVSITDPSTADPSQVSTTAFDAFNLVKINAISTTNAAPLSNAWYLKYDTITDVQFFNLTENKWESVTAPQGGCPYVVCQAAGVSSWARGGV